MYPDKSNVDSAEINKFTKMASEWWDPNGKFKPLHDLNPTRVSWITNIICKKFGRNPKEINPLKNLNILDVGCGGGLLCEPLTRLGANVTGIDAGAASIKIAQHHAQEHDLAIDYQHITIEETVAKGLTFDVVLMMEVIEHVPNPKEFIGLGARLIKPEGLMTLSTLNRTTKSWLLAIAGAEYIMRWLPKGTHDWKKFIKPAELASFCRQANLDILELTGLIYALSTQQWALSKSNLGVNYMMAVQHKV